MDNFDAIISPKSIAVVGASGRPGSLGRAIFKNLLQGNYGGILYPVNPKSSSIMGVKAYPSIPEVPDEIDLAVLIIPASMVLSTMEQAVQKGVKGCIIITAGFKEIGGSGLELDQKLQKLIKDSGIRVVGPNCLGVINTKESVSMNASFGREMPASGNIAFVAQSGGLCASVLDFAAGRNIGFSKFISIGNKSDLNEIDCLRYLKDDPETHVILMYLEDIKDGRAFMETAREVTWGAGKPVIVVKAGRSAEGAKAAASHTGSLAGSDSSYDAIFLQSGVLRVPGLDELFNFAVAFSEQPLPKGNRVAIITNSGGPGIMATDAAIRHKLKLAELSEETKTKLLECLPETASVKNPIDVIGDANIDRYENAMRYSLNDENVDSVIVIVSPGALTPIIETAEVIARVTKEFDKPVLASFMGYVDVIDGVRYLEEQGIPNYPFAESAARALAGMVRFYNNLRPNDAIKKKRNIRKFGSDSQKAAAIVSGKLKGNDKYAMTEKEASELLKCYGFPLLESKVAGTISEVDSIVETIGFPIVMKIASPDILHKSDAGGVRINIESMDAAKSVFSEIIQNAKNYKKDAVIDGVLIEAMAKPGQEVILGATRDKIFGHICMFGLGGIFVEAMKDVTFRLAPMWEVSSERMIQSIRGYNILKGVRGNPPVDLDSIKNCLLRLSEMLSDNPEIFELDINPLIVYPEGQGCMVADARIILSKEV
jgi:acetyltransferase